jgi:hypothetical protein
VCCPCPFITLPSHNSRMVDRPHISPIPKAHHLIRRNIYQDADYLLVAAIVTFQIPPLSLFVSKQPSVSTQHSISQPIKTSPPLPHSSFVGPYLLPLFHIRNQQKHLPSILHPPNNPSPLRSSRGPPFANATNHSARKPALLSPYCSIPLPLHPPCV